MSGKKMVNRNNVVAGVFLIVSIVLAVGIAFTLSDLQGMFDDRTEYLARFPTDIGVPGLKEGAEVTFGGLQVGTVAGIEPHEVTDPQTGKKYTAAHDVRISVDSDLVLFEDAYADIAVPMFGQLSRINIPRAGEGSYEGGPEDENVTLDGGEVLRGRYSPSILQQLGFSTEEAEAMQATIHDVRAASEDVGKITERMRRMMAMLEPEFEQGVDDGRSTIANLRSFSEELGPEGAWRGRVDSILKDVDTASDEISPLLEQTRTTIDEIRKTIDDTRAMISENRPRVASILKNAEQTSERVRSETMGQIDELLEKGSLALGSYQDVAQDVQGMIRTNRPKIDATLSEARDISVQARLFVEEIRAQPWRVLNKPDEQELEREPIYAAARSYASAVADLRVASQALEAAVSDASDADSKVDASEVSRLSRLVEEAYQSYAQAERELLKRLRTNGPTMP